MFSFLVLETEKNIKYIQTQGLCDGTPEHVGLGTLHYNECQNGQEVRRGK